MFKKTLLLPLICLISLNASASSPEDWAAFKANVKAACSAEAAKNLENLSIYVDPYGSESYGLALVTGKAKKEKERDYGKTQLSQICVFDKRTQKVEVGDPFSDADFSTVSNTKSSNNTAAKNSIDEETENCINKDQSTVGMQNCNKKAYQRWDAELNKVYQSLQKMQDSKEAKAALKASQQNWLKFRDSELAFIEKMYQSQQGTYWGIVASAEKTALIKTRVKTLQGLMNSLSPEKG